MQLVAFVVKLAVGKKGMCEVSCTEGTWSEKYVHIEITCGIIGGRLWR